MNRGPRVVKELVNYWKTFGCNVTKDNFFMDITFADEFLACKVTLVGFMSKNCKDYPKCLVNVKYNSIYSSHFKTDVSLIPTERIEMSFSSKASTTYKAC